MTCVLRFMLKTHNNKTRQIPIPGVATSRGPQAYPTKSLTTNAPLMRGALWLGLNRTIDNRKHWDGQAHELKQEANRTPN